MDAPTSDTVYTIDADIPCAKCGYNLRGLEAGGRCPECGDAVGESLVRHYQDRRGGKPLSVEDPGRIKWLRRGCEILLLAMVIWCALHLMPPRFKVFSSRGWEFAMAAPWLAWGLTWLGMMLLSVNPASRTIEKRDLLLPWTLRVSATGYLLLPIAASLLWIRPAELDLLLGATLWCGVVAALTFYRVLMGLAGRMSSRWAGIHFQSLGVLIALQLVFVNEGMYWTGGFPWGFSGVTSFGSPVFGYHAYLQDLIASRLWQYWPNFDPERVVIAAVPFWSTAMLVWLAWALRKQYRVASLRSVVPPKENSPPY